MKWGNVKKRFENAGVEDTDEMDFIDISGDGWTAEWRGDRWCGIFGDPPLDGLSSQPDSERRKDRLIEFKEEHPAEYDAAWKGNRCICGHEHGAHDGDHGACFECGASGCAYYCEPGAKDDDP
jgi:hypothetical protein